ncbi:MULTISPECIES: hypothetical protein [unclassified Mesorhizobium]|uniref:hypothetical protein n=1 Tax=unclassified Mesorhizobium TaxID=325217 RepID=UPI0004CF34E2|nr:hypothetical protein [Mesorhizobium sp. L2C085B000]
MIDGDFNLHQGSEAGEADAVGQKSQIMTPNRPQLAGLFVIRHLCPREAGWLPALSARQPPRAGAMVTGRFGPCKTRRRTILSPSDLGKRTVIVRFQSLLLLLPGLIGAIIFQEVAVPDDALNEPL